MDGSMVGDNTVGNKMADRLGKMGKMGMDNVDIFCYVYHNRSHRIFQSGQNQNALFLPPFDFNLDYVLHGVAVWAFAHFYMILLLVILF
jgi:hypothetical protein